MFKKNKKYKSKKQKFVFSFVGVNKWVAPHLVQSLKEKKKKKKKVDAPKIGETSQTESYK